jgi:hypothetical protein
MFSRKMNLSSNGLAGGLVDRSDRVRLGEAKQAVHGEKGLGESEGGFGSRGDEKERTGVIADGGREGQQDFGF